jgi:hypothetical protein
MTEKSKPIGTYRCIVCNNIYDGSQLGEGYDRSSSLSRLTCPDSFCDGNVMKVSDLPKEAYEREITSKVNKSSLDDKLK